ncbi:hypothetical protein [Lautropia mirabilis]
MNKRLVQRAMQKLVDQNPSRPLHQHTTITPTTTITPSTTTPRTLSQGNAALMASSAEAEEAMAAGIRADIARAEALRQARERGEQVNGRLDTAAGGARIDTQASAGSPFPAAQGQGSADRTEGTPGSASPTGATHSGNSHAATGHIPSSGRPVIQLDFDYLKGRGFLVPDDKTSKIHQEFRLVKRRLLDNAFGRLRPVVGNGRLIMVTSSLPSEGKTFSAINLAISIAIGGEHPVLLIDADIARPSVSNTLQLDIPDEVGLTDYLEDPTIPISELLHETSVPGLSLMTAGHLNHRPVDLLASNNMAQLVERLKTMLPHHVIVFDTPPLLPVTETRSLSALVGQVMLVVAAGETPRSAVNESLLQLENCEAVGLLFNKAPVQPKAPAYYGY